MQASEKLIQGWSELWERGDTKAISEIIGIAQQNVSVILKTGKGSITQIACIQKFYKNRKKAISQIENDLKN